MNYLVDRAFVFYYFLDRNLTPIIFGKKYEYAAVSVIALRGAAFAALCLVVMIGLPLALASIGISVHGLLFLFIFTSTALLMLFCAKKGTDIAMKHSRQLTPHEIVRGFTGAVIFAVLLILVALIGQALAQSSLPQSNGCLDHPSIECAPQVRVIDGDTFEMDGEMIQLWGIDAPELDQTCEHDGRTLEGIGRVSRAFLEVLLQRPVTCDRMDTDQFGGTIARCFIPDNADIGEVMVVLGYAWDYPEFSDGFYAEYEASARDNEWGIWIGDCIPAWEWRERS